jgi:hypothetical protein
VPIFFLTYILYIGTINIVRGHRKKATTFFIVIRLNMFALAPYNIFDAEYLRLLAKKPGYDVRVSDLDKKTTIDGSKLLFLILTLNLSSYLMSPMRFPGRIGQVSGVPGRRLFTF